MSTISKWDALFEQDVTTGLNETTASRLPNPSDLRPGERILEILFPVNTTQDDDNVMLDEEWKSEEEPLVSYENLDTRPVSILAQIIKAYQEEDRRVFLPATWGQSTD